MSDRPVAELVAMANDLIHRAPGTQVYFKVTCRHCGSRLTFAEPNTYYDAAECDQCGQTTPFTEGGLLVVARLPQEQTT